MIGIKLSHWINYFSCPGFPQTFSLILVTIIIIVIIMMLSVLSENIFYYYKLLRSSEVFT